MNHCDTSWVAVITPTDPRMLVHISCVFNFLLDFCLVDLLFMSVHNLVLNFWLDFCLVDLLFMKFFFLVICFCHRTELDLVPFLLTFA